MIPDFEAITELAGTRVSWEASAMMVQRYRLFAQYAKGEAALEVSCGGGHGLAAVASEAERIVGVDVMVSALQRAQRLHGRRARFVLADASALPFDAAVFGACAMFESLYYYRDIPAAFAEAHRVLKPGGVLVVSTINPAWTDFNPSPLSTAYLDSHALEAHLKQQFHEVTMLGAFSTSVAGWERLLSAAKRCAVRFGMIPRTMIGKQWLKRVVFGPLVEVPTELALVGDAPPLEELPEGGSPSTGFKVIYAIARR